MESGGGSGRRGGRLLDTLKEAVANTPLKHAANLLGHLGRGGAANGTPAAAGALRALFLCAAEIEAKVGALALANPLSPHAAQVDPRTWTTAPPWRTPGSAGTAIWTAAASRSHPSRRRRR